MTRPARDGFGVLGVGAAACAACCAGPILAFLGGLGIAGLASTLVIGLGGLVITGAVIAGWVALRRPRRRRPVPLDQPVAVATPTPRTPVP